MTTPSFAASGCASTLHLPFLKFNQEHEMMDRRSFLKIGSGSLSALVVAGPRLVLANEMITVTAFGGIWETMVKQAVIPDFSRRTGASAQIMSGSPPAWMAQIDANRGRPPIDVLVNNVALATAAADSGIVELMDVSHVPNLAKVPAKMREICGPYTAPFMMGSFGLAYHERVKNPPKSVAEMVDGVSKGKWRVALPNASFSQTPEGLIWNLADVFGGSVDNVTPAFQAIQKMKSNAVFWSGISDPLTMLESGDVDIAPYFDGRAWAHYDAGATWMRYLNPTEFGVAQPSLAQKVKNGSALGWDYINSMLDAGVQSKVADIMKYGVSNSTVQYSQLAKERMIPWDQNRWPPFAKIAAVQAHWVERWNKEIGT